MILPKKRDPRFITIRRGGTLTDSDHQLLAVWAADCAQHVLHLFEEVRPHDDCPRQAIELVRAWVRGEITMSHGSAPVVILPFTPTVESTVAAKAPGFELRILMTVT